MKKIIITRLLGLIPVLFFLLLIVFLIVHLIPGDPVQVLMGEFGTPELEAALKKKYGLDKSLPMQFLIWMAGIFRGDLGDSIMLHQPVLSIIKQRLPGTALLCVLGIIFSLIIAIPAGVISALRRNKMTDYAISTLTMFFVAVPTFWLGILLIIGFAVLIPIFPATGYTPISEGVGKWILSLVLPVFTIGTAIAASTTRLLRTSMLEVLNEDYVKLAITKGNPLRRVYYIHALRNAINPIYTTVALKFASLLGGVVIIEKVFAFPGMGLLLLNAIENRDYAVVQGTVFVFALIVIFINMITDICYPLIDPRIRKGSSG